MTGQRPGVAKNLPPELTGLKLAGNDLDPAGLAAWYADEERGFYELYGAPRAGQDPGYDQIALNWWHGRKLADLHAPVALAFGCAQGHDIASLPVRADRIIAIEPTTEFWSGMIAGKPAEYRKPNLSGAIDLDDGSVDFVCAVAALHHVANVEFVVSELARVLRPGGTIFVREPTFSMGDFRRERRGLTRRERGIPTAMMQRFLSQSRIALEATYRCSISPLARVFQRIGVHRPYNHRSYVLLDAVLSEALGFNDHYYRPGLLDRIAPGSMAYIGRKVS
jgi:SAM-dependent methyltransferase